MEIKKLKEVIGNLSKSQGFYGRLYRSLEESKKWKELSKITKEKKIKTTVDLVMFLEC